MLIHKKDIYGGGKRYYEPNTFIGGIGSVINSKSLLSEKLSVTEDRIKNFQVANNNISFYIEEEYSFQPYAFSNGYDPNDNWIYGDIMTYYIDSDGLLTSFSSYLFNGHKNYHIYFPNLVVVGRQSITKNQYRYLYLEHCTSLSYNGSGSFKDCEPLKRIYAPNATTMGASPAHSGLFLTETLTHIYVHPSMLTANSGSMHRGLLTAQNNYGTQIIPVTNFTPPGKPTNLVVTAAGDVNFTPPGSTNTLDFYEVFIDDGTNNPVQLHCIYDEVSASSDNIGALAAGTKVKIRACDEFWNRGEFSDDYTVTT